MKKRWMRSVIEASKTETTVMPFQRGSRRALVQAMAKSGRLSRTA